MFSALLMDGVMDLCILLLAQLSLGALNFRRLLQAQLALMGCTLAAVFLGRPSLPLQLGAALFGAAILAQDRPRRIPETTVCILCGYAVAAGFAALGRPALAPLGGLLLMLLLRRRRHLKFRWDVEIRVAHGDIEEAFPALIDTGNRLKEHRSGEAVLIVEAGAIPRLAAQMEGLPPEELRTLPFGVLGGRGEICCFKPDRVTLQVPGREGRPTPRCWVAVFPGKIPGRTRALAPPEFAEAAEERGFGEAIRDRLRRVRLWRFQA